MSCVRTSSQCLWRQSCRDEHKRNSAAHDCANYAARQSTCMCIIFIARSVVLSAVTRLPQHAAAEHEEENWCRGGRGKGNLTTARYAGDGRDCLPSQSVGLLASAIALQSHHEIWTTATGPSTRPQESRSFVRSLAVNVIAVIPLTNGSFMAPVASIVRRTGPSYVS